MVKIKVNAIKHSYQGEVRLFYGDQYDGLYLTDYVTPEIKAYVNNRVEEIKNAKGYYNDDMDEITVELDLTMEMLLIMLLEHQRRINNLEGKNDSIDGF